MELTSHQVAVIAVNTVFPFVSLIFVILRFYARLVTRITPRTNDYLIIVAFFCMLGQSIPFVYCAIYGGMGVHSIDVTPEQLTIFGKITFWFQLPYIICVSLIKVSIILFYRTIFTNKKFFQVCNVILGIILVWTITFFFVSLFQAIPIPYNWGGVPNGTTINELGMYIGLAVSELALDLVTLSMPWVMIWRLQMTTRRKWEICGIFALGGFVCIASVCRIYYFITSKTDRYGGDITYNTYGIFIWTAIEPCLGLICASLPIISPVFQSKMSIGSLINSMRSYLQLCSSANQSNPLFWSSRPRKTESRSDSFGEDPKDAVRITTTVSMDTASQV